MKHVFTLGLILSASLSTSAQDIKLIDYSSLYARNKVTEQQTIEIKNRNGQSDTTVLGKVAFNEAGYPLHYTEFFARGRRMAEYTYEYDNQMRLVRHSIKTTFNDWEPMDFILSYDSNGRIISRELPETISNFWRKETYTYNNSGVLIKAEQWYEEDGQLSVKSQREYPGSIQPDPTSLTYIHGPNGLLLLHQHYNGSGRVERTWQYDYNYR
jgi:hypothetical protein